jgi:hypothetical protein
MRSPLTILSYRPLWAHRPEALSAGNAAAWHPRIRRMSLDSQYAYNTKLTAKNQHESDSKRGMCKLRHGDNRRPASAFSDASFMPIRNIVSSKATKESYGLVL